jgi:small subunit ribosomal protein S9
MTASPEFRWQAVGRRKTSVARVYLTPGTGKWDINGRTLGDYFPRPSLVQHIQQSFTATDTLGAFDVKAHVDGGGQAGQAGALRHGIARALVEADGLHRAKLRADRPPSSTSPDSDPGALRGQVGRRRRWSDNPHN